MSPARRALTNFINGKVKIVSKIKTLHVVQTIYPQFLHHLLNDLAFWMLVGSKITTGM